MRVFDGATEGSVKVSLSGIYKNASDIMSANCSWYFI